ncbi:MAG: hypothetical protein RL095_1622 [Verrucomicrobiota bacterium]|jgi:alkylated DNA repair dioxygenase AlkB
MSRWRWGEAWAEHFPGRFAQLDYASFTAATEWEQGSFRIFGKETPMPRLSAWFARDGLSYRYSGQQHRTQAWEGPLASLGAELGSLCGAEFNSCLANLYRDGRDSMGWHADDEKSLGPAPLIASISLGASRRFQLRERNTRTKMLELELAHGDLLLMGGNLQQMTQHRIPRQPRIAQPRLNLTYRHILAGKTST